MSFLRVRQISRPQRHMKPIVFWGKSIHFALHTEVNFKCHFCDSAKCPAPKDASNMIPLQCGGHLRKDNYEIAFFGQYMATKG